MLASLTAFLCNWWVIALGTAALLDVLRRLLRRRHSFHGKHVLITGGSSGIGKALAAEFLACGARVTLLARTEAKLKEAVADLELPPRKLKPQPTHARDPHGGLPQVRYEVASISDEAALTAAVARAAVKYGPIDVLVANAGTAAPGLFLEMPTSTYQQQMDLNYMGTLKSLKAVIPEMVERRRGHVIIVSSAVSAVSFLGYSSYAPTKHALRGLADALRNELLGLGIAVQIAYPPDTDTPGYKHENETKPPEVRPHDTLPGAAADHVESQPPPPVCRLSRWCRLTSSRLRASRAALSAPQRRGKTTAHATPHHHQQRELRHARRRATTTCTAPTSVRTCSSPATLASRRAGSPSSR